MTHGAMIAAAAVRQAAAAERHVIDSFRLADATARDRARRPNAIGLVRDATFERLVAAGVVREDARGAFHLDEAALIARRQRKPLRTAMVVTYVALIALLLVLLAFMLSRPD